MIVHQRNVFINDKGQRFEIPLDYVHKQGGFSSIIEFRKKVVLEFSGPDDHPVDHRNISCFGRFTGEVLWLIEEGRGWIPEGNRNLDLSDEAVHYSAIRALYRDDDDGDLWVEEVFRRCFHKPQHDRSLEENGLIARHPDYRNERRYRYVESDAYWIRSDTHELELRDDEAEAGMPQSWERGYRSPEERGYCGVVYHTDMTAHEEEDCLLVAKSAVYISYEVDLHNGRVTPAYA